MRTIDGQVEAAALAKFGAVSFSIQRYMDFDPHTLERVPWFAVFIGGELLGRRRTKTELLVLIDNAAATAAI